MNKLKLQNQILPYCFLLVAFSSIMVSINVGAGNISIIWGISAIFLNYFFISKKYFFDINETSSIKVVEWLLLYNIFNIIRGMILAENYWDWKFLVDHILVLLLPVIIYSASNKELIQSILNKYVKVAIPLIPIVYFITYHAANGYFLAPFSFLLLFFPILTRRWKITLLIIAVFVIFSSLESRSNVLKIIIPFSLSFIYFIKHPILNKILSFMQKLLFIVPLILFLLAVTDTFNIFKIGDSVSGDYEVASNSGGEVRDIKSDTRSSLYIEVLDTAEKYNTWIFGRSPARGNDSVMFGDSDLTGRGERSINEVSILNVFTWTGLVGVVLYGFIFYQASSLAINKSKNIFTKILGLFVLFHWLYAWVEDFSQVDLNTVIIWFVLGLCFSKSFRAMNNNEMKIWVRSIFERRQLIKLNNISS